MRRSGLNFGIPSILILVLGISSCGSKSTKPVSYAVPAMVTLAPGPAASIDVGATLSFTAQEEDFQKTAVTQPVSFSSSNTAVVTVSASGIACAGTWDSISNPQICTPGPVGTAQITASAQGVSSPPTTVYVHQHIDSVTISPLPTQSNPNVPCVSKGSTFEYAAKAFSNNTDITSTVGQFSWQTVTGTVVALSSQISGTTSLNEVQATAGIPGVSSTFASVGSVNSVPFNFITCPVQSIELFVNGNQSTSLTLAEGTAQTVMATVTDSLNNVITGVPLTWSSSNPAAVTVSGSGTAVTETGAVTTVAAGGGFITASCTPPTCNIGFQPSLPIYPQAAIGIAVMPTATTTAPSGTLYVTSDDCQATAGCVTTVVPVTLPANTLNTPTDLPSTPNSLLFSRDGSTVYLGTNFGNLGTKGLMKFAASSTTLQVTQNSSVVGKVLAISPDETKVIVSDLVDPNSAPQVFVYDAAAFTATAISTPGATAVVADFSPDSLKAFIVANSASSSTLYVYSKLDAIQTIPLSSPASDVAFLPSGNFGYIANAPASQLSIVPTCDNPPPGTAPLVLTAATTAPPLLIRPVVSGKMLVLEPPGVELFVPTVSGSSPNTPPSGCAFPQPYFPGSTSLIPGDLTLTNTSTFFNIGQGNFAPRQLIVSQDGLTAYILANDGNGNPLETILTFSLPNGTASAITLAGNAIPLQAALTADGTVLYVGASDGTVHAVSTVAGGDFQQISFPLGLCQTVANQPFSPPCKPDLLAVQP